MFQLTRRTCKDQCNKKEIREETKYKILSKINFYGSCFKMYALCKYLI